MEVPRSQDKHLSFSDPSGRYVAGYGSSYRSAVMFYSFQFDGAYGVRPTAILEGYDKEVYQRPAFY